MKYLALFVLRACIVEVWYKGVAAIVLIARGCLLVFLARAGWGGGCFAPSPRKRGEGEKPPPSRANTGAAEIESPLWAQPISPIHATPCSDSPNLFRTAVRLRGNDEGGAAGVMKGCKGEKFFAPTEENSCFDSSLPRRGLFLMYKSTLKTDNVWAVRYEF